MLKMIKGAHVNCADVLNEEFEVRDKWISSNVNSDKILKIINDFIDVQNAPLFLIIEVPTNLKDEYANKSDKFHKDVYYADGLSKKDIKEVISEYGELFVNDGLAQFGIGNHETKAEIMTAKYNIVYVYKGNDNNKYEDIFINNNIKKVDNLKTAWDYFTKSSPGDSYSIKVKRKSVYDVIEKLKDSIGLYYAERREEN